METFEGSLLIGVAAGTSHTVALKSDGTVVAWGANYSGQIGDGTTTARTTPVAVSGLTNVTAVAAGAAFSVALKSDGTVWTWGANNAGQLGDGTATTTTPRRTPVEVLGITDAVALADSDADVELEITVDLDYKTVKAGDAILYNTTVTNKGAQNSAPLSVARLCSVYCIGLFFNLAFPTVIGGVVLQYPLGALSDRWDRRWVLLVTSAASMVLALAIAFLAGEGRLANFVLIFLFAAFAMRGVEIIKEIDLLEEAIVGVRHHHGRAHFKEVRQFGRSEICRIGDRPMSCEQP